jgi:hypothetical protein
MTMRSGLLAWNIEFQRSDEPIPYLDSLPKMPHSVDDAVSVLKKLLKEDALKTIRNMKEDDLIDLHFGLGLFIRNGFDLWRGNTDLLRACGTDHPDNASGVIIHALWTSLRE